MIRLNECHIREIVKETLLGILKEESSDGNWGWHAGDLGRAEGFMRMYHGGRGTGHFGTGTYFVSSEDRLNNYGYKDRPHHKVNFDGYNLVKINDFRNGLKFHDALRYINNNAFWDMKEDGKVNEKELLDQCWVIAVMTFNNKGEHLDYKEEMRRLTEYRDQIFSITMEILEDYVKYSNEMGFDRGGEMSSDRDSISTELLRRLGFDGVDTRSCGDMDNTMFGSVIYNLKDQNH